MDLVASFICIQQADNVGNDRIPLVIGKLCEKSAKRRARSDQELMPRKEQIRPAIPRL
ncbi:hypothetical protein [Paraburkholderia sp. C35]|uniref:hypothetical protein n=1 Tax=Paraburkholderia sp. C35 TaxID=2126993 RepID=UPI0013A59B83|nr:hypothetical protein [Paraburkholderia sp. C35]